MRVLTLIALSTILASLLPYTSALSEPHIVKPPYTGIPKSISVGPDNVIGIIFASKPMVGLYSVSTESYFEVNLPTAPSKIIMMVGRAYLIAESPPQLVSIDVGVKDVQVKELEDRPGDIETYGDKVIVSFPRSRQLKLYDATTLDEVDSWPVQAADGADVLTASGRYIWVVDESLRAVHVFSSGQTRRVEVEGAIYAVDSEGDRFWAATADGRIITFQGWDGQVQSVQLPRGTVVDAPVMASGGKLFYVSSNRRVVGAIEGGRIDEKALTTLVPKSPSMGPGKRIWFVEGSTSGLGWVADSKPPLISQLTAVRLEDGSVQISARVVDQDGDLDPHGVMAQILVYSGIYVSLNETVGMVADADGLFSAKYVPPAGATRLVVDVVAFDLVGNRVSALVGSLDLTAQRTTIVTTNPTTSQSPQTNPSAILSIALELLLVLPLLLGIAYLAVRRFGKRRKMRK
ncbi:MAG: hypothetical protein QXT66_06530 [Nitrososphaerota archaeon]